MKSAWQGDLPQRLRGKLGEAVLFALAVARSPQLYIDHAWEAYRAYLFSVFFISLVLSKIFHICAHLTSLTIPSLLGWGPTFFFTDIILILLARSLARSYQWRTSRDIAAVAMVLFTLYASSMVSANISHYVNIGMEIQWRKSSGFHKKDPSFLLVISALTVAILIDVGIFIAAHYATPYLSRAAGAFLQLWGSLLSVAFGYFRRKGKKATLPDPEIYEQIAIDDYDVGDDNDSVALLDTAQDPPEQKKSRSFAMRVIVIVCTVLLFFLRCIRPSVFTYSFLSTSLPLAPFAGLFFQPAGDSVGSLPGDFSWLEGRTALDTFPTFDWLPVDSSGAFPDWSPFQMNHLNETAAKDHLYEHYNPAKDPLHIPNLQKDILDPIRDVLHSGELKVKNIVLIYLESNRQDVFPFRSDSYIMKHIKDSYGGQIPEEVMDKLSNLTPTAEWLSGFETGFKKDPNRPKPYGSICAKNAYTSGTYTLKSITGTLCGVNPIAVQNDLEYFHDIYQPCLPHILEALNHQPNISTETDDWTSWPWHPMWMQSHYGTYDHQDLLTPTFGFKDITNKETINEGGAKYIPPEETEEEIKHGHPDHTLKNYMRDAFDAAKRNNNRLFISHLTHNTHTPWFKPGEYEELLGNGDGWNEKINRYLNTIAYQDEWLANIIEVINDAGAADETLLVMTGDHGLSLPNDGGITANHDPHVASFHVPLLLAHPKLPPVEVTDAVLSTQILPSILDLLIETSSVNDGSMKVLKDLLPLYQSQSLLRPLIPEQGDKQEWHFSTMNPGGTWISTRSAAKPYRLVVPLIADSPWRFTNVVTDPLEFEPLEDTDITSLFEAVQGKHGPDAAGWLSEAAHISQWWIAENHRRWKYSPEESNNA